MSEQELSAAALPLFKALADRNRLTIIGYLAAKPRSVEDLAGLLRLGASTVSHHLTILSRAGLVTAKAQGYYSIYSLQTGVLEETAKQLLKREQLRNLAGEAAEDEYDRKVLETFTEPDGRISAFPMQEKKYLVLVRYVLKAFEPGTKYTEKEVNTILQRFSKDTARLRRSLVEYRFMAREGGGGKYWKIDVNL
jgi:hypothetical protein